MPLYTYIVTYQGSSYVAQAKHSNFKGFVSSWTSELPQNAFLGLTPLLKKELSQKAYAGDFEEVPNRKHVWKKRIELDGEEFTVFAVQTEQ